MMATQDRAAELGAKLQALAETAGDQVGSGFKNTHVTVDYLEDEDEDEGRVYRWYSCEVNFEFTRGNLAAAKQAGLAMLRFVRLAKEAGYNVVEQGGGYSHVGCTVDVRAEGDGAAS